MNKDKMAGVCLITVAVFVWLIYTLGFFVLTNVMTYTLAFGLVVAVIYFIVSIVCLVVSWIGYTMATTPPLLNIDIEDIQELREKVEEEKSNEV
jgi:predicted DNA-binding transcriptional regulator